MKLYIRLAQFLLPYFSRLFVELVKHSLNLHQFLYISFSSYPKVEDPNDPLLSKFLILI